MALCSLADVWIKLAIEVAERCVEYE
jgi:hypothetical protein